MSCGHRIGTAFFKGAGRAGQVRRKNKHLMYGGRVVRGFDDYDSVDITRLLEGARGHFRLSYAPKACISRVRALYVGFHYVEEAIFRVETW